MCVFCFFLLVVGLFCLKKISALLSSPLGILQLLRGLLYSPVLPGGQFPQVPGDY